MADLDNIWLSGRVLSASPLVTISATVTGARAGFASIAADLFGDRPALHLLHPVWTLEQGGNELISDAIRSCKDLAPHSDFLMLASNDLEALTFSASGEKSIVGSGLAMLDERVWRPLRPIADLPSFDAVYLARLDADKRHELAEKIESLLLVYGHSLGPEAIPSLDRTRRTLPRAHFANHAVGKGEYAFLEAEQIVRMLSQCRVGLCLSAVEGCMRASMEYLLSGLPVVSTRSVGGRDRYFGASYCRVVDDDPDEIARAVGELVALDLDKMRVRAHVAEIVAFERYNILQAVNGLGKRQFGLSHDLFPNLGRFIGSISTFHRASTAREMIRAALSA